jgi:dTDP-4-amino-4,6-dideoxygalactose transaminase
VRYRADGHRPGELPVAESLAQRSLTVPLYATMTIDQVDEVSGCVARTLESVAVSEPGRG